MTMSKIRVAAGEAAGVLTFATDRVSLFLDLDGTLAPFAPLPEGVGPDDARNSLLREMQLRLKGRMAIVSGRSIADLDRILEGTVVAMAGSHGLQRRDARLDMLTAPVHPKLALAVRDITTFAEKYPGVVVEAKPLSVALHYRNAPDVEIQVGAFADDLVSRTGLKLQRGVMVAEFLSPGMDKGRAVRAFMVEPPFFGTVPLFIGDDLTDEDGFRAVAAFGGLGVLVGPPRQTYARFRLESVDAVHAWLAQALQTEMFKLEVPVGPSYRRI
jgi:trehalose 6-phosphate phosphatase